jgi:hypothetical protein
MASTTKKMKQKQVKKLVKPITRSSNKPFESDTAEVKALVRGLENHLEKNVKDEDIPQVERNQLRAEIEAITHDVSKEITTVGKILPRLRDISRATNMPGAMKTLKGVWLYSEEVRKLGKEEPPNLAPPEQSPTPQSPNLLDSSLDVSQEDQESENEENLEDENTREKESGAEETKEQEETETQGQDLESNQYYKLRTEEFNGSDSSSSNDERKQNVPHQESPATEDEPEKQESDIFTEKIKSGLKDLEARKRQLEKSLGDKVHEAKDRMIEQAAEQHAKFMATSSNNMLQYKKNVQNLVSNKLQELHNVTETWTEKYERAVKHIFEKQGKLFERKCQDTQRTENEKAEKFQSSQENKLQVKADEIEAELLNQAQSLLDQLPMDMGEVKQELEMELREYGDKVRQGMETAENEKHLQQLGESLMAELQRQAAGHKTDLHSMTSRASRGEQSTLPTSLEYTERIRLRNEIVTEIRNDLGTNTADAQWTKLRKEISTKMDSKLAATDESHEEMGGRIALAEVAIDKITDQIAEHKTELEDKALPLLGGRLTLAEREIDNLTDQITGLKSELDDKATELATQLLSRISQLEATMTEKSEQDQVEMKMMQDQIKQLEKQTRDQDQELNNLRQSKTPEPRSNDNPRMATPENENRYKRNYEEASRTSRPHNDEGYKDDRTNRQQDDESRTSRPHNDEGYKDDRTNRQHDDAGYSTPEQPNREPSQQNRWGVDPASIGIKWDHARPDERNQRSNERTDERSNQRRNERHSERNRNRENDYYQPRRYQEQESHNDQYDIPREERQSMDNAIKGFEKRYTNITELTERPTQNNIETLYRQLAYHANTCSIPMKSLKEIERDHPIYPETAKRNLHPQVLKRFSATLYHKLETLIPDTVATYHDIVAQNTSSEDGYTTLYQILSTIIPKLQDFRPKWGPTLDKDHDMYRFVRIMQQHALSESEFGIRPYTELEIITNIIQHALDDVRYEMSARIAKANIQSALAQATTVTLTMQNIAQTLAPSRNLNQASEGDTPVMHKFDAKRTQSLDPKKQVQCRSCQAWGHDGQCFMMCKILNINKWIKENPEEAEKQRIIFAQTNSKRMVNLLQVDDEESLYQGIENMYTALSEDAPTVVKMQAPPNWEEAAADYLTPIAGALHPFNLVPEYIDARLVQVPQNPSKEKETTNVTVQSMKISRQPQEDIREIRFTHQADGGANFAATSKLELLHNYKAYIQPIAIVAFFSQDEDSSTPPQEHTAIGEGILKLIGDYGEVIPMRMLYTPNSTGTVISPERTMKDMQRFNKQNRIVSWSQNGGRQRSLQWKDKDGRTLSSLQMEERNGLYYITNATLLPPPKPSVKAMQTIEPIHEERSDDTSDTQTQTIEPMYEERRDKASDEPSPHAKLKPPIQIETVTDETEETPKPKPDADEYLSQHGVFMEPILEKPKATQTPVTSPPPLPSPPPDPNETNPIQIETATEEINDTPNPDQTADEYLNQNGVFMEPIPDKSNRPDPPASRHKEPKRATRVPKTSPPPQPSPPPDAAQHAPNETANPKSTPETTTEPTAKQPNPSYMRTASWTSNLTKGIRLLEIWHQKMGHPSPAVLQRTQKAVEGIPKLPDATPIFHCRFCDQAKQHKSARGKPEINDAYLPGTMFHMDLGFFRGPSNLEEVVHMGATPSDTTIIKSIEGNVAYLSIVDASSRHLWTFPLKSKHPPIAIIEKFLSRYGTKGPKRCITTNPEGLLAQSQMFQHMCQRNGFDYEAKEDTALNPNLEAIMANLPPQRRIIRTDGGKEFAGSDAFREKCNEHDYDVQVTGPDSSSQNGKGERPHRTLAEKTKCLLYTARLGMIFWCSAIVYATFLYNRTYHSAIDSTPYQAFTGYKPLCGHILTYGCTITAKKPTGRPTKADPNTYEGIFLGYGATSKNIKYHDVHSQRRKWAHHHTVDEFQYGDAPADRSTASKHILETFTQLPHTQVGGKKLHQPNKSIVVNPLPIEAYPNELDIQLEPLPYTAAAAAKFERPADADLLKTLEQCSISLHDSGPTISEKVILKGTHPLLGMTILPDADNPTRLYLQSCTPSTPMSTIPRWRSRLRGAHIRSINNIPVHSIRDVKSIITEQRQLRQTTVTIQFAKPLAPSMADHGVPQLHLDQLNVIAHHLDAIRQERTQSWPGLPTDMPPLEDEDIEAAISKGLAIPRMTRRTVMSSPEAPKWRKTEWTQLSKYQNQGMFGDPCERPNDPNAVILPFVWTYVHKIDPLTNEVVEKARGTCNGGKRHGKAVTIAETYAACVEQPAQRLYWALVAALNLTAIGCDVGNAFAEAPAPTQPFFMYIDDQFRDWWENCLGRDPIPRGHVLKVNKALQGHPEAPRLWHKHIDKIMTKELGFQATTHETCLYHKMIDGDLVLVLRQVDDFAIASSKPQHCKNTIQEIESRMQNPLNDLGTIKRFNGIDILQARDFVKISCETYIDKIVTHHGWQNEIASNQPVPMRADSESLRKLELSTGPEDPSEAHALEQEMGFSYRQAIGELIFAMTVGRIDISYPIIKLSQYSAQPSKAHYQAVKQTFIYLNATRDHGLTYWRPAPNSNHPYVDPPVPITAPSALQGFPETHAATKLHGYVDSDWGSDRQHRRSISGIVFMLAGAAIFYKTRYQPTVALSSTEAEFAAAADAGKAALYLRSILQELGVEQLLPTVIYEDNNGARLMTNAQQPTRRTRHVELKQFAVLQWVEDEQIIFGDIGTAYNISDSLTKQTGRTKFHQHHDLLMGRLRPTYARPTDPTQPIISKCSLSAYDYIDLYDYSSFDFDTVTSMGR